MSRYFGIFIISSKQARPDPCLVSTQTGIISSWYDFAVLVAVFPVCHWGNYGIIALQYYSYSNTP